jgi:hypothetical protein
MNLYIFICFINHDDNPWKILILIMVRTKREEKGGKRWKERAKKGGKKVKRDFMWAKVLCFGTF